jgi:hypothetical protein
LTEEKDSLLWKILAKKKHQTPKSLFEIYQNALKFPSKKKIKKRFSCYKTRRTKKNDYDNSACDYCWEKSGDLIPCNYCDKLVHLKCLKYYDVKMEDSHKYLIYCRKCKKRYRDRRERKKRGY